MSTDVRARAAAEPAFYLRLLELGSQRELGPLLDEALALIVEVSAAATGYLEFNDDGAEVAWWRSAGCDEEDLAEIRASISGGIIARAIAEGRTIDTPSARHDPRFEDLASVRLQNIEAVLCAPVGAPPVGVIYLQGPSGGDRFTDADRERVELFARQLAPLADRLLARGETPGLRDHTAEVRKRFTCDELVGRSAALARVLREASQVAPLDIGVLITGPTGTGKTLLAQTIARNSRRADGPFVALNCAAIPETLIESELFGAERGAHSAALQRTPGKVAAARGGTLFLDEVSELSLAAQAKLLQLLQDGVYYPLGSSVPVNADVRVVSATNQDLKELVARRRFRDDLYYRLSVLPLVMPGLDERIDDIPGLVEHFVAAATRRHRLAALWAARRTVVACQEASWPGHARELANAIEAGVVRAHADGGGVLCAHHVFPDIDVTIREAIGLQEATRSFRRRFVKEALERNRWNVAQTARELEVTRAHLYNLLTEFGFRRDEVDDPTHH